MDFCYEKYSGSLVGLVWKKFYFDVVLLEIWRFYSSKYPNIKSCDDFFWIETDLVHRFSW